MTSSPLPTDQTREPADVRPIHGFVTAGDALASALRKLSHPGLKALGEELGGGE
jgi:hypothetical protein